MSRLDDFLARVHQGPGGEFSAGVFNPWADHDPRHDVSIDAPAIRLHQLARYLEARLVTAKVALIAEAPSYAGAKFCGVAMCCERMMLAEPPMSPSAFFEGAKQRTSQPQVGLHNDEGMLERTASIVWKTMVQAGFGPHEFVNWNAFAWHPHEPGLPLTNRTPTPRELMAGLPVLHSFLEAFPGVKVVAVGQVCQRTLEKLAVPAVGVRHPSYGGAPEFRAGIEALAV